MRKFLVIGLIFAAMPAYAQSEKGNAADRILDIFKAVQQGRESAQQAQQEAAPQPASVRKPMQELKPVIATTTVRPNYVSSKPLVITPQEIDGRPAPSPGVNANEYTAPEPAKLDIRLTPKEPAIHGRGYMSYDYPNSVRISDTSNHVMFSRYNVPGALRYNVRLTQGKRYLINIEAAPENSSGGEVQHFVGSEITTHQFTNYNQVINISRIVEPQETGWLSGMVAQGNENRSNY